MSHILLTLTSHFMPWLKLFHTIEIRGKYLLRADMT